MNSAVQVLSIKKRLLPECLLNGDLCRWSGKEESAITPEELTEVLDYCETQGYCKGWEAARQTGEQSIDYDCPFANEIRGWPALVWTNAYMRGFEEFSMRAIS